MPFSSPNCYLQQCLWTYWYCLSIGLFAFLFRDAAGKITSGHWHPSAPAPCPSALLCSFITSQELKYTLHLPISCTSCNRKSLGCTGERDVPGVMSSEGRGSCEPGLKSASCPEPHKWRPPQPPPVSGGSALCHCSLDASCSAPHPAEQELGQSSFFSFFLLS